MAVLALNKCQSHTAATVKPVGLYVHTFAVYFARLRTKVVTVYGISVEIEHHALSQGTLVCGVHRYVTVSNWYVLVLANCGVLMKLYTSRISVCQRKRYRVCKLGVKRLLAN